MVNEVIGALVGDGRERFVDGTVGVGGHAWALLHAAGPSARLLGLDRDPQALERARERLASLADRVQLMQGDFADLDELAPRAGWDRVDGILLDLGLRSSALDDPERGFAFGRPGPLDMRFDPARGEPASALLARIRPDELLRLLEEGTTRAAPRAIARAILDCRRRSRIARTEELVACLRAGLGARATPKLLASVFSTLRMAVNDELGSLEQALARLPHVLNPGGVLCVIAYQSQEDRRAKNLRRVSFVDPSSRVPFRMAPLWPKPLRPSLAEVHANRRARSARLRAFRRAPLPSSRKRGRRDRRERDRPAT